MVDWWVEVKKEEKSKKTEKPTPTPAKPAEKVAEKPAAAPAKPVEKVAEKPAAEKPVVAEKVEEPAKKLSALEALEQAVGMNEWEERSIDA